MKTSIKFKIILKWSLLYHVFIYSLDWFYKVEALSHIVLWPISDHIFLQYCVAVTVKTYYSFSIVYTPSLNPQYQKCKWLNIHLKNDKKIIAYMKTAAYSESHRDLKKTVKIHCTTQTIDCLIWLWLDEWFMVVTTLHIKWNREILTAWKRKTLARLRKLPVSAE